ncbi:uncharacterized protein F13E9.13, mitochondrial-like [Ylistrum balloti]|uniref:uncharacterized protein F13E9.13, mitochondrial-like n=1 Tax=Ylistrum balloti TaxID=509963 RepID=UPI002905B981|nr:uncharacterized protein F13E9.13, mitochondrial-like [Ylistrum balloti]
MEHFTVLFRRQFNVVLGMIHLKALPGCPRHTLTVGEIQKAACYEAQLYKDLELDGVIVENMNDVPYQHSAAVGHEISASMAVICAAVKSVMGVKPVGVQVLAGANKQALGVAKAAGLDFIRAEGFVFSHVADEGVMNACAGDLLRYRRHIGAEDIRVFTDIKKKHSAHAITSDVSIKETSKAAEFFLSDGVIITGGATGQEADVMEMKDVAEAVNIPVLIGSGVTNDNLHMYSSASGLIVGSHFKKDGQWQNEIDPWRVHTFMEEVVKLRESDNR